LRRLLNQTLPGAEAESERRVHRILHAAGITGWTPNLAIVLDGLRFRLDLAFEAAKVAIEVEGWAFHRDKDRRDRDLAKLNALARHGWILITFNWEHTEDPEYICRSVLTVLAQRSRQSRSRCQKRGPGRGNQVKLMGCTMSAYTTSAVNASSTTATP
jgi:very-short-patch-repair endonuclease